MILIGSRALKLRAHNYFKRVPLDFDFVCTQDELDSWLDSNQNKIKQNKSYYLDDKSKFIIEGDSICEFELVQPGTSTELLYNLVHQDTDTLKTSFGLIPNLDLLFTIKDSHKFKKFNNSMAGFWKTAYDWHLMNQMNANIRPEYKEFHKMRSAEAYNYKHPSLNQSKENFFKDDGIKYEVMHDDIHESVKLFDKPAYLHYMKDGAEVQCDKNKFFNCSRKIQLAGVIEESAVLAIERSLLSHKGVWTPDFAWRFALSKVSSSIASGWFRKFAFDNIFEILKMYPTNYWEKFQEDLAQGKVRRLI